MARPKLTEAQLNAIEPQPEARPATQQSATQQPRIVTVTAKHGRFIDLIKDVEITHVPKEVVWHEWLQANIDAGKLTLV